ncbi:YbaB/EbfC family nucleoid-associated protein [Goodfellowiella coeruleoviolacea]|uniref:Conserved DNA-binding protein YbaB n=1 Tax=Goodfellowiella coeruleoviolacea TaxID=334858 RepID=A0AAE3KG78_9PSEU|nr:YbaB/EbfC family nucleoid-associated protein [Goodfellowiella coeruleoviolacea]MCP2165785.1 Conserved DNA-binding protein YbaB [Goodfellowiella coeruleoviolacea]
MPDRGARLDEAIRAFQEQANQAAQLKDKIAELRGHARNADGSVTVTVAPSGAVLGLQLSPAAMRRSHTQLQQEILTAIRQATQQAAGALQATVEPVLGDRAARFSEAFNAHSPAVTPIGPSAPPPASALPTPHPPDAQPGPLPPQPTPPAPQRTPRPRPDAPATVDDDYFGGSVLT